jgi:filamentous hemagglutinin family protein
MGDSARENFCEWGNKMNSFYRSIWNARTGTCIAVPENARSASKNTSSGTSKTAASAGLALKALTASLLLSFGANVYALPVGGVIAAGAATISSGAGNTTITQSTQNVAINWQSFSIGQTEAVRFVQPNSNSVALNRVIGSDPSSILGNLSANGKVFLINPNGILFGQGASVNVGGLVASTLNITDSDFMAGKYKFSGSSDATIVNQGAINADGGYVALLGAKVSNDGIILARLGTVALAAGSAVTLDVAGDGLLNITVDQGAVNALAQNGGLIQADGGQVLLTARSASGLLQSAVNNTGVIQAQSIENRNGTIMLMGDMQSGTVNVGGTLDASAPNGGNGGFIETSAANVKIANDVSITTAAPTGLVGTWLIDPVDFNIQEVGGDIAGTTLAQMLVSNNITISTVVTGSNTATELFASPGQGNINVNSPIGGGAPLWTATPNTTTLTLEAFGDVNIDAAITATNGNLSVCCGRDVNVRAAITTTNGSVLLAANRDVTLFATSAMSTTNGNIELCAGRDVIVNSKITLINSGSIPSQSLGLPLGLTLSAGNNATGPGIAGGSVYLPLAGDPLRPTVRRSEAPVTDVIINYNPTSYAAPTDYFPSLILEQHSGPITVTQQMLVYPGGADKVYDGTTAAIFTSLQGLPNGVSLVAGPGSSATFDTADVGVGKTVTYSGFTLDGANAGNFALPVACCGPAVRTTTATITPVPPVVVPPDVVVPPVVVVPPDVVVPPVVVVPPEVAVPPVVVVPPDVVVPPVVVVPPEVAAPPVAEVLPEIAAPPVSPPRITPRPILVVMLATPPELQTIVPERPPVVTPPEIYVPPIYPPKQDRN